MMSAGELRERVAFEEPSSLETDEGIVAGPWTERFQRWARLQPLRGTEPIIAQRLAGVQPVVVSIRSDLSTRTVTSAWRVRHLRDNDMYNIRAVTPDESLEYIDLLCETGVAVNG